MASLSALEELRNFAKQTLLLAGDVTLQYFQKGPGVELKANLSPVTVADTEAESLIRDRIAKSFPNHGIFGEEFGKEGDAAARWVIDPIDGTKSFVAGVPLYGGLLSFEEDGKPVVAAMVFPALGLLVSAVLGAGSECNGQPIRVSTRAMLSGSLISCGSHKSMGARGISGTFEANIASQAMATRTWGDAYGHLLVACGRIDAMVDPVVEHYDISAPWLIVHEAGGRSTNLHGEEGLWGEALSSNGLLHSQIVAALGAP